MKLIIAIVRPDRLEAVQAALDAKEVHLMTVSNVFGCGSQRGYTETFRGGSIPIRLLPKVKLEIAVNDKFLEPAVTAIKNAARTEGGGKIGDGKIFILPMDDCVRIRTGETGGVAIGP